MRVLVGGVGYRNLRDHSFGVVLSDQLAAREWDASVSVEDLSYNPIAVVQRLEDDPPDRRFALAIIVGAVPRAGRSPGTVRMFRWDNVLPSPEDIHEAITEAVTGVIALDNTLVIARYFKALPDTVVIVEVEPLLHEGGGEDFSPVVAAAYEQASRDVVRLALDPKSAEALPVGALAHDRVTDARFGLARVTDVYSRRN